MTRFLLLVLVSGILVLLSVVANFHAAEIGFTVGGTLFGFALAQVAASLAAADLEISSLDDSENSVGELGPERWKFVHVVVTNRRQFVRSLVFGSRMAMFCQAEIEFLDPHTRRAMVTIDGRWSSTGEPIQVLKRDRVFDFSKVPALRFDHIAPGKSARLAVAIKNEGQSEFYAFSNLSYAFDKLDNPAWKIAHSRSPMRVSVTAGNGERSTTEFTLRNPSRRIADFKFE